MPILARHIVTIVALSLAGFAVTGCSTVNERLAAGVSDAIPALGWRHARGRSTSPWHGEI